MFCLTRLRLAGAEGEGDDARMRLAELDADFRWHLTMLGAEREEFLAPGEFLLVGWVGLIELDVVEEFAAGQEARVKDGRVDDGDAFFMQRIHEGEQVGWMGIERVAIGEHDPIEIDLGVNFGDRFPVFCADANALGRPLHFEFAQGGIGAQDVIEATRAVRWRGRCIEVLIRVMHGDELGAVIAAEQLQDPARSKA